MAQRVSNEKKTLIIIKLHRTSQGANQGSQTSISKCNQIRGKMILAIKHRNEILKDIIEHLKSMHELVDLIIGVEYNQNIV